MDDIVDIKCVSVIPVADKDETAPVINSLGWNPNPDACERLKSASMIGCVSSRGVHIYSIKKGGRKWWPVVIAHRPSIEGTCLEWHTLGRALVSTSNPRGDTPAKLNILAYDGESCFRARTVLQCPAGQSITSLCWTMNGDYLVLALYPSAMICFLKVTNNDPESLQYLGVVKYRHFDEGSHIILVPNTTCTRLFAYANGHLLSLHRDWVYKIEFGIMYSTECPSGIFNMAYDSENHCLFTIERDKWTYWRINETSSQYLAEIGSSAKNEHVYKRGRPYAQQSEYLSVAVSDNGRFAATGGLNDTLVYYKKSTSRGHVEMINAGARFHDVNYGKIKCIKFNPKGDKGRMLASGGDTGFIHIWAIGDRGTLRITEADRVNEKNFFQGHVDAEEGIVDAVEEDAQCIRLTFEEGIIYDSDGDGDPANAGDQTTGPADSIGDDTPQTEHDAEASTSTSTKSYPSNSMPQAAAELSAEPSTNTSTKSDLGTLSDRLGSIVSQSDELLGSQPDKLSEPYKIIGELKDVAVDAVDTVTSLAEEADLMLSQINADQEFPTAAVIAYLKKAAASKEGKKRVAPATENQPDPKR